MRPWAVILLLASLLVASAASAGLPQAGTTYQGPKTFSSPEQGLSFTLPRGVNGAIDEEFFAIVDPADQGRTGVVLLWTTEGNMADARRTMSQDFVVSGATLRPKSKVVARKNVLTATYSVVGGGALTEARVSTRVAHGKMVAIIGAYAPSAKKRVSALTAAVASSLRISKPKARKDAAAGSGSGSGSGEWHTWLRGARLTRFSTGSGYSEKESYTFCPNGTFYRSFGASSSSGLGTGAAQANNSGRWSVSGKDNRGAIVLTFADGSVDRSAVDYRDGKTFWGGTRYFYEPNQCR